MANKDAKQVWTVNQWGSDPADENDDCWTGEDFECEEDARACFEAEPADPAARWLELDGPDVYETRRTKHPVRKVRDTEWEREHAMQMGMGLGLDAYNDAMGDC